ncbi:hypothetical protein Lepto7376_3129 [[Leptolyngbya] sp. PCC 7376]|uniref:hypothetical protein n=1 Tax=[Leptolyngbya] sp. PCC 7376 TaxID=111781 RepID=UPI00029EFF85|nr:hypothetical protein [[Leptolyngbya] sp. PCC 7376]AFY39366.1 hypothetical protein Lepto7376_3129 [[Leptolyngbya] sp. PCC 7376]
MSRRLSIDGETLTGSKEIDPVNPYSLQPTNTRILWGTGENTQGAFEASKEIANAEKVCGVSYRKQTTGETQSVEDAVSFQLSPDKTLKTFLMPSSCQGIVEAESYGYVLGNNYSFSYTYAGSQYGTNRWFTFITEGDTTKAFTIDYDRFLGAANRPSTCPAKLNFYNGTFPVDFDKRTQTLHSHNYGNMPANSQYQEFPVWEFFNASGVRVLYEHDVQGSPVSEAKISISYVDGTTEDYPLNSCPEWVQIGGCVVRVNYADGTTYDLPPNDTCPTVELVEEELCQKVCNLANQIIGKL